MDYTANLFMKVSKIVTVNAGVELISDPLAKIPVMNNGVMIFIPYCKLNRSSVQA